MSGFPGLQGLCSTEPADCGEASANAFGQPDIDTSAFHAHTLPPSHIPLDFTYVVYTRGDLLSLCLAYLTFLPVIVAIILTSAVALRRDVEAIYQLVGVLMSESVNVVLKRIIRQPRPMGSVKRGYGMPSDHAQFTLFCIVYLSFWLKKRVSLPVSWKRLLMLSIFSLGIVVCCSRVHLGVHTLEQVLAGACVGAFLGMCWAGWGQMYVWRHVYRRIVLSTFGRWLCLKDCSLLPAGQTLAQFEYECYATLMLDQHKTSPTAEVVPIETPVLANGKGHHD